MALRNLFYSILVFVPMFGFSQLFTAHIPLLNPLRIEMTGVDLMSFTGSFASYFLYRNNAAAQEKSKAAIDSLVAQWTQRDKYISAVSGLGFSARIKRLSNGITNKATDLIERNKKKRRFLLGAREKRGEALQEIKLGLEPITSNINRVEIGVSKVGDRMWQLASFLESTLPYRLKMIRLEAAITKAESDKNRLKRLFERWLPLR